MVIDTNPGPAKGGCAAGNMRQVSWARGEGAWPPTQHQGRGLSLGLGGGLWRPPSCLMGCLWEEDLTASLHCVLRGDHAVAHSPGVGIDLKVVPTLHRWRAEKACAQVVPGPGSQDWGPPGTGCSEHRPLHSCSFSCPLRTARKAPFSAFTGLPGFAL